MDENIINGLIAVELAKANNTFKAIPELKSAILGEQTKPDVVIIRDPESPVIIENKLVTPKNVEEQAQAHLGKSLDPEVAPNAVGTVTTAIAVRTTESVSRLQDPAEAQKRIAAAPVFEYAAYTRSNDKNSRYPEKGWLTGTVKDLARLIEYAAEPQDLISQAGRDLKSGTASAAAALLRQTERREDVAPAISRELKQEWNEQTARMACLIMINALAYQQNLAGHQGIKSLRQTAEAHNGILTQDAVLDQWNYILSINYWPIFHIASKLLATLNPVEAETLLREMQTTANKILNAIRHNDVAGAVFQQLITDRNTLATFYTRPESATLLAHLSIPEDKPWGCSEYAKNYRIADFACGSGALVHSGYQRIRQLHRNAGGDPDQLHKHMMENSITAGDIMPAGVHLTASILSSAAPREHYDKSRTVVFPYGPAKDVNNNDYKALGSLDLLRTERLAMQSLFPLSREQIMTGKAKAATPTITMSALSEDLVIMNPPFTRPTNHEGKDKNQAIPNPAFGAFANKAEDQKEMAKLANKLSKGTPADGYAGLATYFIAIAENMIKADGHIAFIVPLSAMTGGSCEQGLARSWQKTRNHLAKFYNDILIVSIAEKTNSAASFSADTDKAECLIIARRKRTDEISQNFAHFVNLRRSPRHKMDAQEMARVIKANRTTPNNHTAELKIGDETIGHITKEPIAIDRKWPNVRISSSSILDAARHLEQGTLRLPRTLTNLPIPITPAGKLASAGPVHRLLTAVFAISDEIPAGATYPMLWNHNASVQTTILAKPDKSGEFKKLNPEEDETKEQAKERTEKDAKTRDQAIAFWSTASCLHISADFRFNSQPTAAAWTENITLGGRGWPTLKCANQAQEKALALWLNSTPGMILYWLHSNRSDAGRGSLTVTALTTMPVLDVTKLSSGQLAQAESIFKSLKAQVMQPANEAYQDPVRQKLDAQILEMLGLNDQQIAEFSLLRTQWCAEPSVVGTKKTGPKS